MGNKKGHILITGGAGFIGFYLAELFRESGFSVRILDVASRPDGLAKDIEYFQGDVTSKGSWSRALQGISHVFHLAAYGDNRPDFHKCFTVNAAASALLYEVIRDEKLPVKQIIVASSQSVYGEGKYLCKTHGVFYPVSRVKKDLESGLWDIHCPEDGLLAEVLPSAEEDKLCPVSPYGISKMAVDHIALTLGRELNIPSVALRYSMASGAYPSMRAIYPNAIKYFTEQALKNESISLHEDGNQSRDFIDIRDLGKAHLAVLDNPAVYFQAFNIGSGKSIKIRDLAEMVYKIVGVEFTPPPERRTQKDESDWQKKAKRRIGVHRYKLMVGGFKPVFRNEFRPFTPRHMVMSIKKIKDVLGWRPVHTLEESITEYITAVKNKSA